MYWGVYCLPNSQCKIESFNSAFKHLYKIWATEWLNGYIKYAREGTYSLLPVCGLIMPEVNEYPYTILKSHRSTVQKERLSFTKWACETRNDSLGFFLGVLCNSPYYKSCFKANYLKHRCHDDLIYFSFLYLFLLVILVLANALQARLLLQALLQGYQNKLQLFCDFW